MDADERVTRITHAAGHCACSAHIGEVMREAFSVEKSLEEAQARIHYLEGRVGEARELLRDWQEWGLGFATSKPLEATQEWVEALSPPMKDEPPKPEPRPNGWGKFSQEEHPATPPMKGPNE